MKRSIKVQYTIDQLLNANIHIGHYNFRKRVTWKPRMEYYILQTRHNCSIINIEHTVFLLKRALKLIEDMQFKKKKILYVGTNEFYLDLVEDLAIQSKQPYVTTKWVHGLLSNWETTHYMLIRCARHRSNIKTISKKEEFRSKIQKYVFKGLDGLDTIPDMMVIFNLNDNYSALHESYKYKMPVVGLVDTDTNPVGLTHPIPTNDDSRASVEFIIQLMLSAAYLGHCREIIQSSNKKRKQ